MRSCFAAASNRRSVTVTSEIRPVAGSPLWQVVFISFGVILILFEVVRGWRLGLMRQIMRLIALGIAYAAAFFGGKLFVPMIRSFFKMPDPVLSILCGALLALAAYALVSGVGAILFKRTSQQESGLIRLIYGFAGAIVGLFFGLFLLWLTVATVRAVGAFAGGPAVARPSATAHSTQDATSHALDVRRRFLSQSEDGMQTLATSLARLKNSLELGLLGSVLKSTDPVSQGTYANAGKGREDSFQSGTYPEIFNVPWCARIGRASKNRRSAKGSGNCGPDRAGTLSRSASKSTRH